VKVQKSESTKNENTERRAIKNGKPRELTVLVCQFKPADLKKNTG